MAFTQEQLDAIDKALASGRLTVTFEGNSVTYRSKKDLMEIRRMIQKELGVASVTNGRTVVAVRTDLAGQTYASDDRTVFH